jgi:zinc finger protein
MQFLWVQSNDVKTGGKVPAKGRKITLKVEDPEDLSRDILKVRLTKSNLRGLTLVE